MVKPHLLNRFFTIFCLIYNILSPYKISCNNSPTSIILSSASSVFQSESLFTPRHYCPKHNEAAPAILISLSESMSECEWMLVSGFMSPWSYCQLWPALCQHCQYSMPVANIIVSSTSQSTSAAAIDIQSTNTNLR